MSADVLRQLRCAPLADRVIERLTGCGGVHIVGGAVRDVLLGRAPRELDFVVEGDAVALARLVARDLSVPVTVHERFATARVMTPELSFDFATARREHYARPGALPEVQFGTSLAEDLRRRDFTVNAAAVSIPGGELTALPHTLADLRAGVLRTLHPQSFADDPTRLLRLCRYAARLGFGVESETRILAVQAIASGALGTVSSDRIGRELRLLTAEPQPAALAVFSDLGVGDLLLPGHFNFDTEVAVRVVDSCPPGADPGLAVLASCLLAFGDEELRAALGRLGFDARSREIVMAVHRRAGPLSTELAALAPAPPSRRWDRLRAEAPEALAVAAALSGEPGAMEVARRFAAVSAPVLDIDGNDLIAAGLSGRRIGEGLRAATAAVLDGRAPSRDEQLAAALTVVDPA